MWNTNFQNQPPIQSLSNLSLKDSKEQWNNFSGSKTNTRNSPRQYSNPRQNRQENVNPTAEQKDGNAEEKNYDPKRNPNPVSISYSGLIFSKPHKEIKISWSEFRTQVGGQVSQSTQ